MEEKWEGVEGATGRVVESCGRRGPGALTEPRRKPYPDRERGRKKPLNRRARAPTSTLFD